MGTSAPRSGWCWAGPPAPPRDAPVGNCARGMNTETARKSNVEKWDELKAQGTTWGVLSNPFPDPAPGLAELFLLFYFIWLQITHQELQKAQGLFEVLCSRRQMGGQ